MLIPNKFLEFLKNKFGGSGGGAIKILNDGEVVTNSATELNFIGNGIRAVHTEGGVVNVYSPVPQYSSHFNTQDGTTNGLAKTNMNVQVRNIAHPFSEGNPYYVGSDWYDNLLLVKRNATNSTLLDFSTNGFISILENSFFDILVQDGGETVIADERIVVFGNGTYTKNNVIVYITNWQPEDDKYKCNVRITINTFGHGDGRYDITLSHNNLEDGNFLYSYTVFRDTGGVLWVDSPILSLGEGYIGFEKKLSGIGYLGLNTPFKLEQATLNDLLVKSYNDTMVQLDFSELAVNTINLDKNYFGIETEEDNRFDNVFSILNYTFSVNVQNQFKKIQNDKNFNIKELGWSVTNNFFTIPFNLMIDTYVSTSNRIIEDFRNENFRLKNSDLSPFNSDLSIEALNELQVMNSKLIYPSEDFIGFLLNTFDYSGCVGDRFFVRKFWHDGVNHSNGIFRFENSNITENDILEGKIDILISLDGNNWFSACNDFITSPLNNGDGCRINTETYSLDNSEKKIQFTIGFESTNADSDWGIFVKIQYSEGVNLEIGKIILEDWV